MAPRPRGASADAILTSEQQDAAIADLLRSNETWRRRWHYGFSVLCLFASATCAWLAYAHADSPFEGPATAFVSLEAAAPGSELLLVLGMVVLALSVEGVGFIFGFPRACYVALVLGAFPVAQFVFLFLKQPQALVLGWRCLWLPLAVPFAVALGLYGEASFDSTVQEIERLGGMKYEAHTA